MATLSGTVEELITPRFVERMSARSGVSDATVRTGMSGAVATILDGLVGKANDPRAMGQVTDLVRTSKGTDQPEQLLEDEGALTRTSNQLLGVVGGDSQGMITAPGRQVGVGAGAAAGFVSAAAAVVIGAIRKLANARGGLDAGALASTLRDEGKSIHAAVPSALLDGGRRVADKPASYVHRAESAVEDVAHRRGATGSSRWVVPVVIIAGLITALWLFARSCSHEPAATKPAARAPAAVSEHMAKPVMTFPAGSTESKLVQDITATTPVDQARPLDLTGGDEQLANVARILVAYPNARVQIGGSPQRADAVRQTLVSKGIDASRIETKPSGVEPTIEVIER